MSSSNLLTQQILSFLFQQNVFAWRASSVGVYDQRLHLYRTAPKKGVSDILACHSGRLIAIEIKINKDSLSPEQKGFLKNIEHAGGLTFVAKDFDSFLVWWSQIEKK